MSKCFNAIVKYFDIKYFSMLKLAVKTNSYTRFHSMNSVLSNKYYSIELKVK